MCRACLSKPAPLISEHFCRNCRTPFLNAFPLDENGLCGLCRHGLNAYDFVYSYGAYENELRALIQLFKYGRVETLGRPLGKLLASALPRDHQFDVIVPMPLHWMRRWTRGFNQAEVLALVISRRTGIRTRRLVRRERNTAAQASLTDAQRRDNVVSAFRARPSRWLTDARVLLVDDVLTTGATAGACAAALKKAGARSVTILTLARTDRRIAAAARRALDKSAQDTGIPESPLSGSFEDAKSGSIA